MAPRKDVATDSVTLKLEDRPDAVVDLLRNAGHDIDPIESFSSTVVTLAQSCDMQAALESLAPAI